MGQDKALMPFAKASSMSLYQYKKLSLLFEDVYISAKVNKFSFDCKIIEDKYPESSPLVALVSLLESIESDAFFILCVDAPLVERDTIERLIQAYREAKSFDAIIARTPKGIEPLCAIYSKSILPVAKRHLLEGNHKMKALLAVSTVLYLDFKTSIPFSNVNTPKEYEEAMCSLNQ